MTASRGFEQTRANAGYRGEAGRTPERGRREAVRASRPGHSSRSRTGRASGCGALQRWQSVAAVLRTFGQAARPRVRADEVQGMVEAVLRTCVADNVCFEALGPIRRTEAGAPGALYTSRGGEVVSPRPLLRGPCGWRGKRCANGTRKKTNTVEADRWVNVVAPAVCRNGPIAVRAWWPNRGAGGGQTPRCGSACRIGKGKAICFCLEASALSNLDLACASISKESQPTWSPWPGNPIPCPENFACRIGMYRLPPPAPPSFVPPPPTTRTTQASAGSPAQVSCFDERTRTETRKRGSRDASARQSCATRPRCIDPSL